MVRQTAGRPRREAGRSAHAAHAADAALPVHGRRALVVAVVGGGGRPLRLGLAVGSITGAVEELQQKDVGVWCENELKVLFTSSSSSSLDFLLLAAAAASDVADDVLGIAAGVVEVEEGGGGPKG